MTVMVRKQHFIFRGQVNKFLATCYYKHIDDSVAVNNLMFGKSYYRSYISDSTL